MRVSRGSEGLAPAVEKLECAGLDRAAGTENEGPERSGDAAGILERLGVSSGREDVLHRVARPFDDREGGVRVGASRDRASVLRGERDDGDVEFLDAVGACDAKVGAKLGAWDKRLKNNTEA